MLFMFLINSHFFFLYLNTVGHSWIWQKILFSFYWLTINKNNNYNNIFALFFSMNDLRRLTNMIQNYSVSCSDKGDKRYLFQIKVNWLSIVTLFSVLVTFLFCVLWTVFFKLEEATGTHCGVRLYYLFFKHIYKYALIWLYFMI